MYSCTDANACSNQTLICNKCLTIIIRVRVAVIITPEEEDSEAVGAEATTEIISLEITSIRIKTVIIMTIPTGITIITKGKMMEIISRITTREIITLHKTTFEEHRTIGEVLREAEETTKNKIKKLLNVAICITTTNLCIKIQLKIYELKYSQIVLI